MPHSQRSGDLIGKTVPGRGRIADMIIDEQWRITAVIVVKGPWGRLLGYERDEVRGPWLIEHVARLILRRDSTEIAWHDLPPEVTGDLFHPE
ncbi:hypothetical protein [Actinoplanes sp. NPDC051851]|uniref:hypothetical protein n=1 Tax=Actinoplanes sp. NPDC051851 TaxID=3154753 RepID=UPI003416ED08